MLIKQALRRLIQRRPPVTTVASVEDVISGDFGSWEEAAAMTTGLDSASILDAVTPSLLAVKNGTAAYERDSVIFDQVQYSWPLLSGLLWVAAQSDGELQVIDYGGSLGTTYFQNRRFLRELRSVRWNVVEQPHYVKAGRRQFESDELRFHGDLARCAEETGAKTIVLSGVLNYIEKVTDLLSEIRRLQFETIIIDRTSFWDGDRNRIAIQRVPPSIYDASFPIWVFSSRLFREWFSEYEIIAEFPSFAEGGSDLGCEFRGLLIRRSEAN